MCPQLQIYNRNPIIINFLINPIIFRFVVVSGFSNSKKILKKKKKKNRALEKTYIPFFNEYSKVCRQIFCSSTIYGCSTLQLSIDIALKE